MTLLNHCTFKEKEIPKIDVKPKTYKVQENTQGSRRIDEEDGLAGELIGSKKISLVKGSQNDTFPEFAKLMNRNK